MGNLFQPSERSKCFSVLRLICDPTPAAPGNFLDLDHRRVWPPPAASVKDFSAITMVGDVPNVVVVHPALPVKTMREFVDLAKKKKGELHFASSASITFLGTALLNNEIDKWAKVVKEADAKIE